MKYHWSDKNKLEKDNKYLTNLYEKYLIYITNILNKFHNESKDIRYWRIIVGPWLRFFIDIVFDRYETLKCDDKFKPNKINFNFARDISLRSKDFSSFINESYKDNWNKNLLNLIRGMDNKLIYFKSERTPEIKFTRIRFLLLFIYLPVEIVVNLLSSFLSGLIISLVYKKTHKGLSYSQSFMITNIFLSLIVCMVI